MGVNDECARIREDVADAVNYLLAVAKPTVGNIFVLGASTSEVQGKRIGSAGSKAIAQAVVDVTKSICDRAGLFLAVQCCEHLNRSLVVERALVYRERLNPVTVIPSETAGGTIAVRAMETFVDPVVVEAIEADLGMDIGDTFIGMHLRRVAVPVRMAKRSIGEAHLTLARTRPPLVGGTRAVYPRDIWPKNQGTSTGEKPTLRPADA